MSMPPASLPSVDPGSRLGLHDRVCPRTGLSRDGVESLFSAGNAGARGVSSACCCLRKAVEQTISLGSCPLAPALCRDASGDSFPITAAWYAI